MKIDKQKLLDIYLKEVNNIFEVCDWKTHLTPKEIVDILSELIEKNPTIIDRSDECRWCGQHLDQDERCYCWNDD